MNEMDLEAITVRVDVMFGGGMEVELNEVVLLTVPRDERSVV